MGKKLFRFLMAPIVGFATTQAIIEFYKTEQWGLIYLTIVIFAFGLAILFCVWDLIDYKKLG